MSPFRPDFKILYSALSSKALPPLINYVSQPHLCGAYFFVQKKQQESEEVVHIAKVRKILNKTIDNQKITNYNIATQQIVDKKANNIPDL